MIIVVTPQMRHLYQDRLDQMYRLRYEVCVKQWGWKIPNQQAGVDKDDFDTDDTIYLMYFDERRDDIIACCRLNPTTKPYMLSELWPQHCDLQPLPNDSKVWESSRFVVSGNLDSKAEYLEVMWRTCVAITEYCLRVGIEAIAWYTSPIWYQTMNSVMPVQPLGRPHHNTADDETYIAGIGHFSEDVVRQGRSKLADPTVKLTYILSPLEDTGPASLPPTRRAA